MSESKYKITRKSEGHTFDAIDIEVMDGGTLLKCLQRSVDDESQEGVFDSGMIIPVADIVDISFDEYSEYDLDEEEEEEDLESFLDKE